MRFRICKTIDVVTEEREKVHTQGRGITREGITRPEFLWKRPYSTHADTLDPKRSLFTSNVKAVGDTCVTTAHGQGVRNQSDQNQQRQEVCFSMSGDALTLQSDMSKNAGMNVRVSSD